MLTEYLKARIPVLLAEFGVLLLLYYMYVTGDVFGTLICIILYMAIMLILDKCCWAKTITRVMLTERQLCTHPIYTTAITVKDACLHWSEDGNCYVDVVRYCCGNYVGLLCPWRCTSEDVYTNTFYISQKESINDERTASRDSRVTV